MKRISEILKKYEIKPYRYTSNGKVTIVDTEMGRFAIKERVNKKDIFSYLKSRSFDYFPKVINEEDDEYEISEFIEDTEYPNEQKIMDMVNLVSLLHNKTTHFKEVDFDDYKKIYEDVSGNIEYLTSYYNDIITFIDTKVYMSPSEYLLARNISKVYASLNFCKGEIDKWYKLVEDKTKQRHVVLHNNLDLSHFIKSDKSYLTSWNKSKIGIPIFDLYILYRRHALEFEFSEIFKYYEQNYPLLEDERLLFFILITLPPKLSFDKSEYENTCYINEQIDLLYKTEKFISPYYSKNNI